MKLLFKGKVKDSILGLFAGAIHIFTGFLELLSVLIRVVAYRQPYLPSFRQYDRR